MSSYRMTERIDAITHRRPKMADGKAVMDGSGEPVYEEVTPAQEIHEDLDRDLGKIEPTGTDLLVGVYVRPTTKLITDALGRIREFDISQGGSQTDDKYQGKVCLVLKCGPHVEEAAKWFKDGKVPQPGDWVLVMVRKRDQFLMGVEENGLKTRHVALVPADGVSAVLTDPDCFL